MLYNSLDHIRAELLKSDAHSSPNPVVEFLHSAVYGGIESPCLAMGQAVDQLAGTKIGEKVKSNFHNAGIAEPQKEKIGTGNWYAQQLGTACGMLFPLLAIRKGVKCAGDRVADSVLSDQFSNIADHDMDKSISSALRNEAIVSGTTGAIYGAMFTPSKSDNLNGADFIKDRLASGTATAATFAALGYGNRLVNEKLGAAAASLEKAPLNATLNNALRASLRGPILPGAIAGLPAGAVSAEINAWKEGRPFASQEELKQSMASMSFVGGAFCTATWLGSQRGDQPVTNGRYITDKLGITSSEQSNNADFKLVGGEKDLREFHNNVANGADKAEANLLVRRRMDNIGTAIFGKGVSDYADYRHLQLLHKNNPATVISEPASGKPDLIATCAKLAGSLQNLDVIKNRAGENSLVYLSSTDGKSLTISQSPEAQPNADMKPVALGPTWGDMYDEVQRGMQEINQRRGPNFSRPTSWNVALGLPNMTKRWFSENNIPLPNQISNILLQPDRRIIFGNNEAWSPCYYDQSNALALGKYFSEVMAKSFDYSNEWGTSSHGGGLLDGTTSVCMGDYKPGQLISNNLHLRMSQPQGHAGLLTFDTKTNALLGITDYNQNMYSFGFIRNYKSR